ncbi:GNAT family N-acetyltransferase [Lysinibacillus fusiformis]|uniref:GNAT family N-acetyltransferase n=1 Tax=Lysinibacillus fusiformis TaxID=28031 RepID=UPI001F4EF1FA|nr:GNAT family N-acetyltransferase [Lysinibacillus fusiformis]MCK1988158.1 GNAT family N-acetyltransferase [Lysinibacillus fusiformis]
MKIETIYDYEINGSLRAKLQYLLTECFAEDYPKERIYFKQLPHFRFIATDDKNELVGQVGLDYRIMNLNGKPIRVLGIIDLCVSKNQRSQGIGSLLLSKIDEFCKGKSVDFLLLFADNKKLYVNAGFKSVHNECTWLKIDNKNQTTNGIGYEKINELMIKEIGNIKWEDGKIDLLGYLY